MSKTPRKAYLYIVPRSNAARGGREGWFETEVSVGHKYYSCGPWRFYKEAETDENGNAVHTQCTDGCLDYELYFDEEQVKARHEREKLAARLCRIELHRAMKNLPYEKLVELANILF